MDLRVSLFKLMPHILLTFVIYLPCRFTDVMFGKVYK